MERREPVRGIVRNGFVKPVRGELPGRPGRDFERHRRAKKKCAARRLQPGGAFFTDPSYMAVNDQPLTITFKL